MKAIFNKIILAAVLLGALQAEGQLAQALATNQISGDKFFDKFYYIDALEAYLRAYDKNPESINLQHQIAECYRFLNNPRKAEEWYGKVATNYNTIPTAMYYYAEALQSNGKFDQAKVWFTTYAKRMGSDPMIEGKIDAIENIIELERNFKYFAVRPVEFNSDKSDFSPVFYKEGVVFASARKEGAVDRKYHWDNTNYLDLFYVKENSTKVSEFDSNINTKLHDGPIAFYNNGNKAVFTRNNFVKGKQRRGNNDTNYLQLFFAEKIDGVWTDIEPFEYNDPNYSLGHASISEDGSYMVFASDKPGGQGESDLFITTKVGGGWTVPENLGDVINTKEDELFPFIKDSILYFASKGHGGLGGLDMFSVNIYDPQKPMNLGAPLNSTLDDFGIILDGTEGYFSSNRHGDDDIFYFEDNRPSTLMIRGVVLDDASGDPISNAEILLENGNVSYSDANGNFTLDLPWNESFTLASSKEGYDLVKKETRVMTTELYEVVEMRMRSKGPIVKIHAIDENTKSVLSDALINLRDKATGKYLQPLSTLNDGFIFRVTPNNYYELIGAKQNYFTNQLMKVSDSSSMDWEIPLKKISLNEKVILENIYYDLDKATLREDAYPELNILVKWLEQNPNVKIELSSHTDSRGGKSYNLDLSQRRAESVVNYLIKNNIDANRIVARGYGENQPVNGCIDGSNCSEEMYQKNRRTEFQVISINY